MKSSSNVIEYFQDLNLNVLIYSVLYCKDLLIKI